MGATAKARTGKSAARNGRHAMPKRRRTKPGEMRRRERRQYEAPPAESELFAGIKRETSERRAELNETENWERATRLYALVFIPDMTGPLLENALQVPGAGLCSLEMDEQSYDPMEPVWFTDRAQAFERCANLNRRHATDPEGHCWFVVVEIGNCCWFASVNMGNRGKGNIDLHDLPIRIVKPTAAEVEKFGMRKPV